MWLYVAVFLVGMAIGAALDMLVHHLYPKPEDELLKEYLRREYGGRERPED